MEILETEMCEAPCSVKLNVHKITNYLSSFIADTSPLNDVYNQKEANSRSLNSKASKTEKKTLPKSRHDFQARLSSFKYGSWTSLKVSPFLCASYGWALIAEDILQCVTCQALICTSLPPPSEIEAYEKFLEVLKGRIITGHKDWCGWPLNPCPEEFIHPPFALSIHCLKKFSNTSSELALLEDSLPFINISELLGKLDLEQEHLLVLFKNQTTLKETHYTAAVLTLFGWTYENEGLLRCSLCLRKIGLWNCLPLKKKEEYLSLKEREFERKALREIKEAARKAKKLERLERVQQKKEAKEEEERKVIEEERRALEAEKEAFEQMEIDRIRQEEALSHYESMLDEDIEGIDEEIEEEEEFKLLGYKHDGDENMFNKNSFNDKSGLACKRKRDREEDDVMLPSHKKSCISDTNEDDEVKKIVIADEGEGTRVGDEKEGKEITDEEEETEVTDELKEKEVTDEEEEVITDEEERVTDEEERVSDEEERVSDEEERVTDEEERVADEEERVTDEEERVTDEEERVTDEEERVTDEEERVTDEEEKATDEEEKATDEEEKATDEEEVVTDEDGATDEEERVTDNEERVTDEEERSNGEEIVTDEEERVTNDGKFSEEEKISEIIDENAIATDQEDETTDEEDRVGDDKEQDISRERRVTDEDIGDTDEVVTSNEGKTIDEGEERSTDEEEEEELVVDVGDSEEGVIVGKQQEVLNKGEDKEIVHDQEYIGENEKDTISIKAQQEESVIVEEEKSTLEEKIERATEQGKIVADGEEKADEKQNVSDGEKRNSNVGAIDEELERGIDEEKYSTALSGVEKRSIHKGGEEKRIIGVGEREDMYIGEDQEKGNIVESNIELEIEDKVIDQEKGQVMQTTSENSTKGRENSSELNNDDGSIIENNEIRLAFENEEDKHKLDKEKTELEKENITSKIENKEDSNNANNNGSKQRESHGKRESNVSSKNRVRKKECIEKEESGGDDDLWMEAVGIDERTITSTSSSSDYDEDDLSPRISGIYNRSPQTNSDSGGTNSQLLPEQELNVVGTEDGNHLFTSNDMPNDGPIADFDSNCETQPKSQSNESNRSRQSSVSLSDSDMEDDSNNDDQILLDQMEKSLFNPIKEHRPWCGWIAQSSLCLNAEELESVLGYQIVPPQLKTILPELCKDSLVMSKKYVQNIEGLRAVRNMLYNWTVEEKEELSTDMEM